MDTSDKPIQFTFTYDREGTVTLSPPKRRQVSITPGLARLFARAAAVNRSDVTPLSFTSLLIGMMTGVDPTPAWVRDHLQTQGVTAKKIAEWRSRPFDENLFTIGESSLEPELAVSVSARRVLEEAQKIAAALQTGPTLHVRHLVAAYPILPDWHVNDFNDLGIDRLAWCRAFGAHMAKSFESEKWYWREYADRASPVPLTSFSADVYTEKDLLGIDRSVDALALLMASTRTDTPLSIGVFGPWGSGKSFFMRHLRKRIWSLAEREQKRVAEWVAKRKGGTATADDAPMYYGQVAQVEFNAWHYNEGNLVASLVDHLFRNLRVLPDRKDEQLEERRADVLLKISGAEIEVKEAAKAIEQRKEQVVSAKVNVERVSSEVASTRADVDAKAKELEDTATQAEQARTRIDSALKALADEADMPDAEAFLKVALRPFTESPVVAAARDAIGAFGREAESWRSFASQVFSIRGLLVIGLCLLAPLALWFSDLLTNKWTALVALAGPLAAGFASFRQVIGFIGQARQKFEAKMKEAEQEETRTRQDRQKEFEAQSAKILVIWNEKIGTLRATLNQQRATLAEREEAVVSAARALAERTKELDQKVQERASAEAKLREAEAQLRRLSSALLLDEFIKDRSATDEYRKQLGFLALVRRDFERLSDLISAANEEWCSPDKDAPPPLLNRIILYIDDLDRCKVETVLSVLEAVHLLLAFPLFVCVVAVDPLWIEKCLRQKHQYLFGDEKALGAESPPSDATGKTESVRVTVGDYLEKIFQIPIWMNPIDAKHRSTLVKSLLGTTAAPEARATRTSGSVTPQDPAQGRPLGGAEQTDGFQAKVAQAEAMRDPLRITNDEAMFVDRVGPLLSDKPRALKRFVNVYRLLKASLPDIDRESFVSDGPSSPYKICLSQLAFFTGQPRLAPAFVHRLAQPAAGGKTLQELFEGLPDELRTPLQSAVDLVPDRSEIPLEDFRAWLPYTTKYLFHRQD